MKKVKKAPKVFFNASVILAGLHSPKGGSGALLDWSKKGQVQAFTSEIVIDETIRNLTKIKVSKKIFKERLKGVFKGIAAPSSKRGAGRFSKIVVDMGDAHLFRSAKKLKVEYLVSLDKKHVLSLKSKFKKPKIINPGELIEILKKGV